jgi:putative ABC transport system permease protein
MMRGFWLKLKRRRRMQQDLEAELEFHRDMARRAGNPLSVGRIREEAYDAWRFAFIENLWRDLIYAVRGLRKAPSLVAAAIVSLALGIGANTAMFAVIYGELRPLPFPQPERLVAILEASSQFPRMSVSYPDLLDWSANNHVFTDLAGVRGSNMILAHSGTPVMVIGQRVTANYFHLLGVAPALGRGFLHSEDRPGAPDVVVVSDHFWHERLNADSDCLGRVLDLDGRARTIVGVMPPGFPGFEPEARRTEFWTPLGAYAGEDQHFNTRGNHGGVLALGRLRAGVALEAARKDLAEVAGLLASEYPATNKGVRAAAQSYLDLIVGNTRPALWFLMAAVGLVLLIACANVAGLLLARVATQRRLHALRAALGASRARIVRSYLFEALTLGLAGCALGIPLSDLCLRAVPGLLPTALPRALPHAVDTSILAFAVGAAVFSSLLCGLIPALEAGRLPIARILQEGVTSIAHGRHRIRNVLVVFEMALALVLLLGAGVMLSSLTRLQRFDTGLAPRGVLTFIAGLPETRYPQRWQQLNFFRDSLSLFNQLPGVQSAAGIFPLPFGGNDWEAGFAFVGRPAPERGQEPTAKIAVVRGPYFAALGIHRLRGRDFDERDTTGSPGVAIVDSRFAKQYWPDAAGADRAIEAAMGQQINLDGVVRTIVGIVASVNHFDSGRNEGQIYIPQDQTTLNTGVLHFVLKSGLDDPIALRGPALDTMARLDPLQAVTNMRSMEQLLSDALAARRHALDLMSLFALLALVLSATGVYGVVAYSVAERTPEIGIRMALGAGRTGVMSMVLRQGLHLALAGAAAGLLIALMLVRLAGTFLPGLQWHDPLVFALAPTVLIVVTALACYVPARRATRVDPLIALRF